MPDVAVLCSCTDGSVCSRCVARYRRQLAELAALLTELDTTAARQGRGGSLAGGKGKGSAAPLPYDPAAADLAREIRATIVEAPLLVLDDAGLFMHRARSERFCVASAVGFLLASSEPIRPAAAAWLNDVSRRGRQLVLGRRDRWFAGVCGAELIAVGVAPDFAAGKLVPVAEDAGRCEALLFAETSATVIRCRECGAQHKLAGYRDALLAVAEDEELPLPLIIKALPWLTGLGVKPSTVRSWLWSRPARHGTFVVSPAGVAREVPTPRRAAQLLPRSVDRDGVELFRLGDVVDLAVAAARRSAARAKRVS